ncbi:MAG: polyprenyl synthetase family protein [Caldilineaceae bacterium]|nr:polyprenyl synthetase family protein [Caldilineaceae bacterium]MCB9139210.1 polyprenyl synthetase family protein [Caldilineaceae bacterium]
MTKETLQAFIGTWLPRLEEEMRRTLDCSEPALEPFYGMMGYHLGWRNAALEPERLPAGKRLRPMLCLLACAEAGGDPFDALPAAAAIELLHNFSLIHDDVEDGDETRRHRATVWAVWGVPQAINAGDGMFALSFRVLQRLRGIGVDERVVLDVLAHFTTTCLELTEGQYLDMRFEARDDVTVEEYLRMISGKTAALIGAALAIGARIGGASLEQVEDLRQFGRSIGLTFQIQDDILGIWGDPAMTGKAAGNDILRRKKSLPLLYALNHPHAGPHLHEFFVEPPSPQDVPDVMALLDEAGARAYAEGELLRLHEEGVIALARGLGDNARQSALYGLAEGMLQREA